MTRPGVSAYDVAEHYDDAYFADLAGRYRRRSRFARQRIANVFALLPGELAGKRLLDVGCGMGTFAIEAGRKGARATGVDFAPAALRAAARVAAAEGVAVSFLQGDGATLPVRAGSFDVVLAADVTEHLDEATLAAVLGEAHRVLAHAGRLVLYTPEGAHVFERLRDAGHLHPDPSHIGIRSAAELAAAVALAGFRVDRVTWLPSHLPGWNLLERGLARWVPLLRRRIGLVAAKP
jgi:2-polyprenyl-3-methyl-5-hydroxy-6-metoxy-1,4-benzoquinol methylase